MKDTFAGGDSAHLNGWAIAKLPDPMLELFEIHFAIIIYIAVSRTSSSIIIYHHLSCHQLSECHAQRHERVTKGREEEEEEEQEEEEDLFVFNDTIEGPRAPRGGSTDMRVPEGLGFRVYGSGFRVQGAQEARVYQRAKMSSSS